MQLNILRLDWGGGGQGRHRLVAMPTPGLAQDSLQASHKSTLVCWFYSVWQRQEVREREGQQACGSVAERAAGWPQGWEAALCRRLDYSSSGFCRASLAWLSSPCLISRRLLSAHPSVDKWPAGWLLVTLPGGGVVFSNSRLAIWAGARGGGSPHGGGQAQHHPWGFRPRTRLRDIPLTLFGASESCSNLYPHP